MNNCNIKNVDPDSISDLKLVKQEFLNKKITHEGIREIFEFMPFIGIYNPYVLLDILVEKKRNLLKDFFKNKNNALSFNFSALNKKYFFDQKYLFNLKQSKEYLVDNNMKDGTYHNIFLVLDTLDNQKMILRKQKGNGIDDFFDSCTDFFIHSILSLYQGKLLFNQNHYRGKIMIPKIHYVGTNCKANKVLGIMNLFNGTVFDILSNNKIKNKIKKIIVFNCLHQIASFLKILQDKFKFNHNDLKINNIFYESQYDLESIEDINQLSKIKFFLADFGFSRLKFHHPKKENKVILLGGALLNYSTDKRLYNFISGKDLYFLCHNMYVYSPQEIKKYLLEFYDTIGDFDLNLTIENNWMKIYDDYINRLNYKPHIFLKILESSRFKSLLFSEK